MKLSRDWQISVRKQLHLWKYSPGIELYLLDICVWRIMSTVHNLHVLVRLRVIEIGFSLDGYHMHTIQVSRASKISLEYSKTAIRQIKVIAIMRHLSNKKHIRMAWIDPKWERCWLSETIMNKSKNILSIFSDMEIDEIFNSLADIHRKQLHLRKYTPNI